MIERETYKFKLVSYPKNTDNKIYYGILKKKPFSKKFIYVKFNSGNTDIDSRDKAQKVWFSILESPFYVRFILRLTNQPLNIKGL